MELSTVSNRIKIISYSKSSRKNKTLLIFFKVCYNINLFILLYLLYTPEIKI